MAIVESPVWEIEFDGYTQDDLIRVTEEIAEDCRRGVPVDTGELLASIHTAYRPGVGYVVVGTDHWAPTEYGSEDHIIRPRPRLVSRTGATGTYTGGRLRFYWLKVGRWVTVRHVHHPGTPAQPYMRPSLYRRRTIR